MNTHKDLEAWKNSISLVTDIYTITKEFPTSELYGLVSQIRGSAVSIPTSISEGAGRANVKEYVDFLTRALGSLAELETQLIISNNLGFVNKEVLEIACEKINIITGQICGLIKYLNAK